MTFESHPSFTTLLKTVFYEQEWTIAYLESVSGIPFDPLSDIINGHSAVLDVTATQARMIIHGTENLPLQNYFTHPNSLTTYQLSKAPADFNLEAWLMDHATEFSYITDYLRDTEGKGNSQFKLEEYAKIIGALDNLLDIISRSKEMTLRIAAKTCGQFNT